MQVRALPDRPEKGTKHGWLEGVDEVACVIAGKIFETIIAPERLACFCEMVGGFFFLQSLFFCAATAAAARLGVSKPEGRLGRVGDDDASARARSVEIRET